jgi:hypothetical protein
MFIYSRSVQQMGRNQEKHLMPASHPSVHTLPSEEFWDTGGGNKTGNHSICAPYFTKNDIFKISLHRFSIWAEIIHIHIAHAIFKPMPCFLSKQFQ